jgi:histidine ammonia-lyase
VVAVRALRLARQSPVGTGTRELWSLAERHLDPDLSDRPLHPDIEIARRLIADWKSELG